MHSLQQSMLMSLAYTSQFEYPLTPQELYTRLISSKSISVDQYQAALLTLISQNYIQLISVEQQEFLVLKNAQQNYARTQTTTRLQRQAFSAKKWQEIIPIITFLQFLPGISGVLITGSLAMNNATKNDDVDFLIITKPHMLWILRPLVVGYSWIFGKRRSWQKEEKNSWCFNLWLDENHLQMPLQSRSIYTAYELYQAKWLVGMPQLVASYYTQNSWAGTLLPQYSLQVAAQTIAALRQNSHVVLSLFTPLATLLSYLLAPFNVLLFLFQHFYMLPHKTTERVGYGYAFFHPRNTKQLIFTRWKEALLQL